MNRWCLAVFVHTGIDRHVGIGNFDAQLIESLLKPFFELAVYIPLFACLCFGAGSYNDG